MRRVSRFRKLTYTGAAGLSLFGGAKLAEHAITHESTPIERTAEKTGEIAAAIGLVGLALSGTRRLQQSGLEKQQKEVDALWERLPMLAPGADVFGVMYGLHQINANPQAFHIDSSTARAITQRLGPLTRGYSVYGDDQYIFVNQLQLVTEQLIGDYAHLDANRNDAIARENFAAAMETCWFLDRALPIDEACPRTPQTDDSGKYWFDFVQAQASQLRTTV